MKKSILLFVALLTVVMVNAQTVEEIVKKYTAANKLDKMAGTSTVKITGKMSAMGMDLPVEMWMKNPDKMRMVMNMMGQEVVTIIDGKKGYTINPMTGSSAPVEMPQNQVDQNANQNIFNNYMEGYLKKGAITYQGNENVGDKPAYKLKINVDASTTLTMFIDKATNLLVKTSASTAQGNSDVTYFDYKETNGVFLPMKTITSSQGMEMVMIFEKVEVNIPMDDALFKLK
jgi:hypothetical protein